MRKISEEKLGEQFQSEWEFHLEIMPIRGLRLEIFSQVEVT